jgi:ketosteroid isomerase-like protein
VSQENVELVVRLMSAADPSANIWTVRAGGIARIEVYVEHDHALKAVGLEG